MFLLGTLYAVVLLLAALVGLRAWAIHDTMSMLKKPELGQVIGNPEGSRVVVEIIDYRCAFCRNIAPVVRQLIADDPELKVVVRHKPIFGEKSIQEAEFALAAAMQGKFAEAHEALIARTAPATQEELDALAASLSLDREKLEKDMKGPETGRTLLMNIDATENLKINSTPTFIIGKWVYVPNGMPDAATIAGLIDKAYD